MTIVFGKRTPLGLSVLSSNLCRDAAMDPLRDLGYDKAMSMAAEDLPAISYDHIQHSLSASNRSVAEEELVVYEEWNKLYGSS